MLPDIVDEQLIRPFNFYFNGNICQGMTHQGKLYRLTHAFEHHKRAEALALACELSTQGGQIVITTSTHTFRVWVDLRSIASMSTVTANNRLKAKPSDYSLQEWQMAVQLN